jgi:hypothetical protein
MRSAIPPDLTMTNIMGGVYVISHLLMRIATWGICKFVVKLFQEWGLLIADTFDHLVSECKRSVSPNVSSLVTVSCEQGVKVTIWSGGSTGTMRTVLERERRPTCG